MKNKTIIIAEAGVNHQGNIKYAIKMIAEFLREKAEAEKQTNLDNISSLIESMVLSTETVKKEERSI